MRYLTAAAVLALVLCVGSVGRAAVGTLADGAGVVTWGSNNFGQYNNSPSGTFTAIAAGGSHSVGLRTDGTIVTWGNSADGEYNNSPTGTFTAVNAGTYHSVGLRTDGTVVTWGSNLDGQYNNSPTGTFTAVEAADYHSVGLRSDGTIVTWGGNSLGQYNNSPNGTFTAIDAGNYHSVGLRTDGTVVTWGSNFDGQNNNAPTGTFTAIDAGLYHSVGLRSDGTVVTWGSNSSGQNNNPPTGTFTAIAAGYNHSVALRARTDYDGDLLISGSGMKTNLNRSIQVAGNVLLQNATATFYNNAAATAAGKLQVQDGTLSGAGSLTAAGVDIQGSLSLGAGSRIVSSGPLTGSGNLTVGSGPPFNSQFDVTLAPAASYTGVIQIAAASGLTFNGAGLQTAGSLFNGIDYYPQFGPHVVSPGGSLRVSAGGQLRFTNTNPVSPGGGTLAYPGHYNGGAISVEGIATAPAQLEFLGPAANGASTGMIAGQSATFRFTGGLTNNGSLALTAGLNNVSGDIANSSGATITVTGGASAVFYDDIVQNGTFRVAKVGSTASTAVVLGSFTGGGGSTGGGDIFFEGDLRPGNSPASVTFANNIALGSGATTNIELAGTTPGTQYDHINVSGQLSLGGNLLVSLLSGFAPAAGQSFDILDWASLSGAFDTLSLPALGGGLAWNTTQLYSTGVLSVVSVGVPGDYNNNGTVDAGDYLLWRKGGPLANEVDAPGTVNGADYAAWRARFGNPSGAGADAGAGSGDPRTTAGAVPEPAAAILLLSGLTAVVVMRRRGRKSELAGG